MEQKRIHTIFNQFSQMRIMIIGDIMIDSYLWGHIDRFSPEAPVPVVNIKQKEKRLGGAANVALNLQSLGATPLLFSVIGDDLEGKFFLDLLAKREISSTRIITDQSRITTVKSRIINKNQQIVRVDEEHTNLINKSIETKLIESIQKEITTSQVDAILFVDYDKGVLTPSLFKAINKLALENNIPTSVDPKVQNFKMFKNVTLFKPNLKEFETGINKTIDKHNLQQLIDLSSQYKKKKNIQNILITLSELGIFINDGENSHHYPTVIRKVADVSGAGDTVLSIASLAMAAQCTPQEIAIISNIAGGLVCGELGVAPIDKKLLMKELSDFKL